MQILPPDVEPADAATRRGDVEWLTEDTFATMARDLAEHGAEWDARRYRGRWSLAGAQPTVALFRDTVTGRWGIPRDSTPTTHIVKPALAGYEQHHVNEVLCLRAAREAGLFASTVELAEVADVRAVIAHRYDRRQVSGRWVRLHQEDLCQALAIHPSLKYQSDGGPGVSEVGELFSRLPLGDRAITAERFFKGLAFNALIGGADAHAKNYSLLLIGPRAQLAPLYDVASAAPYSQHSRLTSSMKIGEHWKMLDTTEQDWRQTARRLGIGGDQATAWVGDLRKTLPDAFTAAVASLPSAAHGDAEIMADRIIEHVRRTWRPR
ncbi:MAG: HipA domain-containing protein [Streptosporangiaceae bacterium]